jgi:hypothetical protein
MGALIMTKGTKRLMAHYNDEFDTWIAFYRDPAVLPLFNRSGDIDIWGALVQTITDLSTTNGHTERADHLTLLPKNNPKHAGLHARWKVFLQSILSQANRNLLADCIHTALTGTAVYIIFDVRVGPSQTVTLVADTDDNQPIARITIVVTQVMPVDATADYPDLARLDE